MREFMDGSPWGLVVKIALCIAAYLLGAVNFATVISRLRGDDVRKSGSGNPGTMNMMRIFGKGWGALTFVCDCAKGVLCALAGMYIAGGAVWLFALGGIAVIGHVFPIYTKFKGGKGVATSLGVYLVACPIVAPIVLAALVIVLLFVKYGFIGSLGAITTLSIYSAVKFRAEWAVIVINTVILALIVFTHRSNIVRLAGGKENVLRPIGGKKKDGSGKAVVDTSAPQASGDDGIGEATAQGDTAGEDDGQVAAGNRSED